ncbi:CDP-alcohol phosphatidyltransferase family protein [Myxococcota bacterium]|jgi:phosphatidylglycerophosphate synthase|nr:CDP-alcohol phosphatidyltransferase family protein [Myxococcota bacterium]
MLQEIRRIYRESLKPADSLFNLYVARPPAAAVVAVLARTRATPNQVTFASIAIFVVAMVALAGLPGWAGLLAGVGLVELSYVFDCADGQLARLTKRSSPVGALLDFLMDELKAYLLVAGITVRAYLHDGGGVAALMVGLGTLVVIGSALALTKFVRTPEYAQATGTKPLAHGEASGAASRRTSPLWPVQAAARLISQYPTTLPLFAVANRLDLFLYAYAAVHVLYIGQTSLVVLWRLGRFAPHPAPESPP